MAEITIEKASNGYVVTTDSGEVTVWSDPRDVLRQIVEHFSIDSTVLPLEALEADDIREAARAALRVLQEHRGACGGNPQAETILSMALGVPQPDVEADEL